MSCQGVDYRHLKTADGGDLYLTRYGQPRWEHLLPENWYDRGWFESQRERLVGSSTVYRVPTRRLHGTALHLVVKWSRVGEVVPLDTLTVAQFINAEFNSPFEEFSLLMELRRGESGPPDIRIHTQRPLAIFVPGERLQLWQTGRSEDRIRAKLAQHPDVELDVLRQYVVLYGWVKGRDAVETADDFGLTGQARAAFLARTTSLAIHELAQKGCRVVDMKPAHLILRPRPDGTLLRDRHGQVAYALVDYELLERTPEHEHEVRAAHRQLYLKRMVRRFESRPRVPLPAHLQATRLLEVDYIFGHAESTCGWLWVVGRDPDLFNYFLPERWRRTRRWSLSSHNQVFHTGTKDGIHLVWRVSRMGDRPVAPERAAVAHGFNSPFEEFAHALQLGRAGVPTVYPRAIYRTGHPREAARPPADRRRYETFAALFTPDGLPAVSPDYDYVTLWGFWNGPDEVLAERDGHFYRGINARHALRRGLIAASTLAMARQQLAGRMAEAGFEDLHPKPDHLLISIDPEGVRVRDTTGLPELRLCNFELIRPISCRPAR